MGKEDENFLDLEGIGDDEDLTVDKDDIDDEGDDQDVDLEKLIASLSVNKGDDDDDEEDEEDEDLESADGKKTKGDDLSPEIKAIIKQQVDEEVVEKLNKIVPERLQRDRKSKEVARLEQIAGMPLDKITETVIASMVADKADELGISEDEAREILKDKIENVTLKTEKLTDQQHQTEVNAAMQQVNYLADKTKFTRMPKLAGFFTPDVIAEIDAFSNQGAVLSFADAAAQIFGQKVINGELVQKVQAGAAQKAKANASVKGKSTPSGGGGGASRADGAISLTREQRQVAVGLGLTSKEDLKAYAADIQRENQRKQRRGR